MLPPSIGSPVSPPAPCMPSTEPHASTTLQVPTEPSGPKRAFRRRTKPFPDPQSKSLKPAKRPGPDGAGRAARQPIGGERVDDLVERRGRRDADGLPFDRGDRRDGGEAECR